MDAVWIVGAGLLAGAVNAIAGGGTLISFPALVWLGRDPVRANATNALALVPGALGGVWGYRAALRGARPTLGWFVPAALLGGALGGWLLMRIDSAHFSALVSPLILLATLLLAAQEPLSRWMARRQLRLPRPLATSAMLLTGVYGGFFGAGIGILMLATLGLAGETEIHRMNGLKNALALTMNLAAAVEFAAAGLVDGQDAALLAASALVGGYLGARGAQRVDKRWVRRAVIVLGLLMAWMALSRT